MKNVEFDRLMTVFTAIEFYGCYINFQAVGMADRSREVWDYAKKHGMASAYRAKMATWEKEGFESLVSELLKQKDYSAMARFLENQAAPLQLKKYS